MSTIDIIPITSRMGVEIAGVDLREELSETVIHEIRPVVQHLYRHIENLNFHASCCVNTPHLSKIRLISGATDASHTAQPGIISLRNVASCRVTLSGTSPS